jgi:hypothetical protein
LAKLDARVFDAGSREPARLHKDRQRLPDVGTEIGRRALVAA